MHFVFHVPDMSCDHCRMRIEKTLGGSDQVKTVRVDLDSKKVEVDSSLDTAKLIDLFDEAGYDAELLQST